MLCRFDKDKDAIIKKIVASNGEIISNVNSYVKKGDIIVSGEIKHNEEIKKLVKAKAKVYGEVWYKVNITIPLTYYEEIYTNNVNTGYFSEATSFSEQWMFGATITGCSGDSVSAAVNSNNSTCEEGYAWNESNNKVSTTGNTSGIYDMSGGNWEYMMSVVTDKNENLVSGRNSKYNSGFNGIFGCPTCDSDTSGLTELTTGIDYPTDTRYYDLYEYDYDLSNDIRYDYTNGKLGDATKEIAATKANSSSGDRGLWYTDYANFPSMSTPWFLRGGNFANGTAAGVLYFARNRGNANSAYGSRVVLAY